MIIFHEERRKIYENLFKEGVLTAKRDYNLPEHPDIEGVSNLKVIKACQSLKSKNLVKTQFNWNHYYYTLTSEGVEYLRTWLHLPAEIVPATYKSNSRATARSYAPRTARAGGDSGYRGASS